MNGGNPCHPDPSMPVQCHVRITNALGQGATQETSGLKEDTRPEMKGGEGGKLRMADLYSYFCISR